MTHNEIMHSSFHSLNHLTCGLPMKTENSLHVFTSFWPILNATFVNIQKIFSEQVFFLWGGFFVVVVLMCIQRADVENVTKLQMHRILLLNVSGNIALKYYFSSCLLLPQTSFSREPSKNTMLRMTKFNLHISCF